MAGKSRELVYPRFKRKIRIAQNGCWIWQAGVSKNGYGTMWFYGRQVGAHVVSYILHKGPIPADLQVNHNCPGGEDNKLCCNPAHLWLGTQLDNIADRDAKGHTTKGDKHWVRTQPEKLRRGNAHPMRKLSEEDVFIIRWLYHTKRFKQYELASRFDVCSASIGLIVNRRLWTHI